VPDFWTRLQETTKRVEEKTKMARAVTEAAVTIVNPLAAPVAQSTLAPQVTPTEIAQDIELDRDKGWADHELFRLEERNKALGTREWAEAERIRRERETQHKEPRDPHRECR
jgi:hypothetical protein